MLYLQGQRSKHSPHSNTFSSYFQNVKDVYPEVSLRFSVHDVCMCGRGMWGWASHSHESAAVQAVETQTCRSEAHIAKHQYLTSKGAMHTERQLIQVNGCAKTKEAIQVCAPLVFKDLSQEMCLLAKVKY